MPTYSQWKARQVFEDEAVSDSAQSMTRHAPTRHNN